MLAALVHFLVIDINIDPTMAEFGPFTLTWHGFFTAVGIIAGVSLSVWLAKKDGIPPEVAQEIALVGVPAAIIGARLFFVAEHWDQFSDNPAKIVTGITEGGITLYGALLGGVLAGVLYGWYHKWPLAIGLDAAAPGMLLGQGIGRIGDLINGEHHADASSLPWAFRYTNPNTLGELGKSVHPVAGGYELLGDFLIMFLLLLVVRRYSRVPGWVFCAYMALYGVMRFFFSYFRTDEQVFYNVPIPQIVSGLIVGSALILAAIFYRWPGKITPEWAERVWGDLPEPEEAEPAGSSQAAPA